MNVIIKSGKRNWSGKEFSELPAKIYSDFDDAVAALNSYHFFTYDPYVQNFIAQDKPDRLEFIFLTEKTEADLLKKGQVRW